MNESTNEFLREPETWEAEVQFRRERRLAHARWALWRSTPLMVITSVATGLGMVHAGWVGGWWWLVTVTIGVLIGVVTGWPLWRHAWARYDADIRKRREQQWQARSDPERERLRAVAARYALQLPYLDDEPTGDGG